MYKACVVCDAGSVSALYRDNTFCLQSKSFVFLKSLPVKWKVYYISKGLDWRKVNLVLFFIVLILK